MVLKEVFNFFIHLDTHLDLLIQYFGLYSYLILFIIIFVETGLVIIPFLPEDSLLFLAGAFAARGLFNVIILFIILSIAAILGDTVNYWIGSYFGKKLFKNKNSKIFKQEYLEKTQGFYHKYGGKTIIIARFIPIIRTFAPFVAGVGKMHYPRFLFFNIIGGISWIAIFLFGGFLFGNLPFIQENLSIFILIIIIISIIPPVIEYVRNRKSKSLDF